MAIESFLSLNISSHKRITLILINALVSETFYFLLTNRTYFLYRLKQALITDRLNLSPEEALDFARKLKVNIYDKKAQTTIYSTRKKRKGKKKREEEPLVLRFSGLLEHT